MVLPLVIGGAVIVGALVFLSNSQVAEGLNRLTKGKERKGLEVEIERYNHVKDKRGFFNNAYAFIFGETALSNTYQQKNAPQPVNTGQQKFNDYGNRKKATRFSDV